MTWSILIDEDLMRDIAVEALHVRPNLMGDAEPFFFRTWFEPSIPNDHDHLCLPLYERLKMYELEQSLFQRTYLTQIHLPRVAKKGAYQVWMQINQLKVTRLMPRSPHERPYRQDLLRSRNAKLAHFGLKRCALHAELERRARRPADDPIGFPKSAQDVLPLRLFQSGRSA